MQRTIGGVAALILFVIVKLFTTDGDDAVAFNDEIVPLGGEMSLAFDPPLLVFDDYLDGKQIDVPALRQSLDAAIARLDELNAELADLSIPDDDRCREFHAAVTAYGNHWKLGSNSFKAAVDYMEAHNPPQADAVDYIDALLEDFFREEERLYVAAGACQEAMAEGFGLEVIEEE